MGPATPAAASREPRLLGDALLHHYAVHGLPPDGGESAVWFRVQLGPVTFHLPNPPSRKRAVLYHDVNHILTGYDTVFTRGEMDIAGFELGAGCGKFLFAWLINACMATLGMTIRPRAIVRAFRRGRQARSIYSDARTRSELMTSTVSSLRE